MDPYSHKTLGVNRPVDTLPIPTVDGNFSSIVHMHASRSGPLVANDIFLSLAEARKNPSLKRIIGVFQPFPTTAKILSYWTASLSTETVSQIIDTLARHHFIANIDGEFSLENLRREASSHVASWKIMVEAFAKPVFNESQGFFLSAGYDHSCYEELMTRHDNDFLIDFESALLEISMNMVNTPLAKLGLPVIDVMRFDFDFYSSFDLRGIDKNNMTDFAERGLTKQSSRRYNALAEIAKRLRPFNGRPVTHERVLAEYETLKSKSTSSCSAVELSDELLKTYFQVGIDSRELMLVDELNDRIIAILDAHKRSLTEYKNGRVPYLDGQAMIDVCFAVAKKLETPLALQEFIRPGGYDRYTNQSELHPEVVLTSSAARIWDTNTFPEFDLNLVQGLHYLGE